MTAIEIKEVDYSIRHGFWLRKKRLLKGVSLSISEGEAVALVGQNGAGKTTLFKIAAGLIPPDSGHATINDISATHVSARLSLSFLTENQYVYPHLTIREWILFMGRCLGMAENDRKERTDSLMEEYGLLPHAEKRMKELSKGLRQRTMLAQLFLNEPHILILDEPMSGLDHLWREKLRVTLNRFREGGGTLLFSTHILPDVEALCDRVVYLDQGAIKWDGSIDEVLSRGRQMQVVLKKGSSPLPLPAEPLWERRGQVAAIIPSEAMDPLQEAVAASPDWHLLRVTPHIPSLEAMFSHDQ